MRSEPVQKIINFLRSRRFRRILLWCFILFLFLTAAILLSNQWIINSTGEKIYSEVDKIPKNDVAVLLGASRKTSRGGDNLFFLYRIEAAATLYKAGKIKHIIVSGDNHKKEYDEASDMRAALVELGVPDSCITLDYAGFRTLDSMVRCLKVFGQKDITVISQEFHNQRAVFIGQHFDMNVIAFNAKDVPEKYSTKTKMREYLAKFKAVLDLYILDTEPKFLGEKITIRI
jgi:SanA protein